MTSSESFEKHYSEARKGHREAREWLLLRYGDELLEFLRQRSGSSVLRHEQPEDVAQRVMLAFLERLPSFPEELTEPELKARLFQIGKWLATDVAGRDRRELREGSVEVFEPARAQPSQGSVTRRDDVRHLRGLIERLREPYANVLKLYVLEGNSLAETSRRLSVPEETVKKRLVRARSELRRIASGAGVPGDPLGTPKS